VTMGDPHVLCLGDVMTDILASLSTDLAIHSDTPATTRLFGGGSAANTASWLAAEGVRTAMIARVGADAFGRAAGRELTEAGVQVEFAIDGDRATGSCVVLVHPDGERTMIPDPGANAALSPEDVPPGLFIAGRHLHLSAYSLFHGAGDAAAAALALARAASMTITVDAASAAPLAAYGAERFANAVGGGLVVLANIDEAVVLAGTPDASEAARHLGRHFGGAVIKLGAEGSVYSDGDEVTHAPAVPIELLDSTGAGDAFAAGLIRELIMGAPVEEFLRAGNELAARACARLGSRP